jgi:hypothetical protein
LTESRTKLQRDANDLDLKVFRLIGALEQFSEDYRERGASAMALDIKMMRHVIRKHMHPKDREATS